MQPIQPLRKVRDSSEYSGKDVLAIFGEVVSLGYVNGLISEAQKVGMKVIYGTIGRRDEEDGLKPLTSEELAQKERPMINIPLECGFDLEKSQKGISPADQLKGIKLSDRDHISLDLAQLEESRKKGRENFRARIKRFLTELQGQIPPGANVLLAHTMSGGVPRAKIVMPILNRVVKGCGDRFASSQEFCDSDVGNLFLQSFMDVTANSFSDLIELSAEWRENIMKKGGQVSYVAFGYRGTEVLAGDEYRWQSYRPYLQGWAKRELENIATFASQKDPDLRVCVFNAPEIRTFSSTIFVGVELPLYRLLAAFKKMAPKHSLTARLFTECAALVKPDHRLEEILDLSEKYLLSEIIQRGSNYESWPQHNDPQQMELMLTTSEKIMRMHRDQKVPIVRVLSDVIFRACGRAMILESLNPPGPVTSIGHDYVVEASLS